MKTKAYANAAAFRTAIESRLVQISQRESVDIMRLRRHLVFDRFLCRVFHGEEGTLMLKGGYAMELRVSAARTTKDIDLCMKKGKGHTPTRQELQDFFSKKAALELGDFLDFSVHPPKLELTNAPYGGYRFVVEANMASRLFLSFSIDVAVGDVWLDDLEALHARDWLRFAGISSCDFPSITVEQQLSEKIHSYTLPRQNPNSRTKDLVDIILLTRNFKVTIARMHEALNQTFKVRKTHAIPDKLQEPPISWENKFAALAKECDLKMNLSEAFSHMKAFYEKLAK